MQYVTELEATINAMVQKGRGVLAADESSPTIASRFKALNDYGLKVHRLLLD